MQKERRLLYDIGFGALGIVLMAAAAVAFWAHFRLGDINATTTEFSRLFLDGVEEQKQQLRDIRLAASLILVGTAAAVIGLSPSYYRQIENPRWELKKSLVTGAIMTAVGLGLYLVSGDPFPRAMGASVGFLGVFFLLVSSLLLAFFGMNDPATGGESSGSYCSDCGTEVRPSASYCDSCGSNL